MKVVQYKQQSRLEEKRKKALDLQLDFIVGQTEKYSDLLSKSLGPIRPPETVLPTPKNSMPAPADEDGEWSLSKINKNRTFDWEWILLSPRDSLRLVSELKHWFRKGGCHSYTALTDSFQVFTTEVRCIMDTKSCFSMSLPRLVLLLCAMTNHVLTFVCDSQLIP